MSLILISCGGGGGSSAAASDSSSSSSSTSLSILYDPPTGCTLSGTETLSNFANSSTSCNQALTTVEKEILALSLNNPISGFTESQLLYASDISDSFKTQARTALNDAAAVFGFYDLNYFGIGSSVSAYESDIKSQFCAVLGLATCTNAGTMAYLYDIANGGSPEDAGANVPGFTTDAYSNPPKKNFFNLSGFKY
jgi:hypothetical protein